jgi:hypothetical protein
VKIEINSWLQSKKWIEWVAIDVSGRLQNPASKACGLGLKYLYESNKI